MIYLQPPQFWSMFRRSKNYNVFFGGLEDTAYLSSCLLLLITFGAMVGSWFFERRIWCRHLCPIGGMNGLYAKLAVTELRAQNGNLENAFAEPPKPADLYKC